MLPSKAQMNKIKMLIVPEYYICWVQGYIGFFGELPWIFRASFSQRVSSQPHLCAEQQRI